MWGHYNEMGYEKTADIINLIVNKNLTKSLTLFNCSYNKILVKRKNINEIKNYIECA